MQSKELSQNHLIHPHLVVHVSYLLVRKLISITYEGSREVLVDYTGIVIECISRLKGYVFQLVIYAVAYTA